MPEFHELWPDEYEQSTMLAYGAIFGYTAAKGEEMPYLSEVLHEALRRAFAEAFDAGARAHRDNHIEAGG